MTTTNKKTNVKSTDLILRHYTNYSALKGILNNGLKFSNGLASQNSWDDQNDVELLKFFHDTKSLIPYTFSFTKKYSIHHWEYYGNNTKLTTDIDKVKCCIVFYENKIKDAIYEFNNNSDSDRITLEDIKYYWISEMKGIKFNVNKLPFIKRKGFYVDDEIRLLLLSNKEEDKYLPNIISCIKSILFYKSNDFSIIKQELTTHYGLVSSQLKESTLCYGTEWLNEVKTNTINK